MRKLATPNSTPELDLVIEKAMASDYGARRRFMRSSFKRPLPNFLYRYESMRLEQVKSGESQVSHRSIDRLRVPLVESLLPMSSPRNFNDPFDMCGCFNVEATAQEKRDRYANLFDAQNLGTKDEERQLFVEKMMQAPPKAVEEQIRISYEKGKNEFGVICFATDPQNVLMWSHYAGDHSGVCLQFDPAHDLRTFTRALPIDYEDSYPTISWFVDFPDSIGRTLLRKHTRWKYEDEHRILFPDHANTYLKFLPGALTGVILGCRAGQAVESAVRDLLKERVAVGFPEIQLLRTVQNQTRYELGIVELN